MKPHPLVQHGGLNAKDGKESVSGRCDCQPQGSRELGWRGMVNESEPLINVVNTDKRKRLGGLRKRPKRLDQKVRGQV